jgi:hypothetical protein
MKKLIAVFACLLLLAIGGFGQGPTGRAVTQTGAITSAVTINSETGVITTVATTLAGASATSFTVNNSACTATSTVVVDIQAYGGTMVTNGFPAVSVDSVAAGSFLIRLMNVHPTNALANTLQIGFLIR